MRKYETIFIADPDVKEDVRKQLFEKFKNLLVQKGGIIIKFDDWGNKKLAYAINKKPRGHYVYILYAADGEIVKELERNFRLDEKIMKFMTIILSKDISSESIAQEVDAEQNINQDTKENQDDETQKNDEVQDPQQQTQEVTQEDN